MKNHKIMITLFDVQKSILILKIATEMSKWYELFDSYNLVEATHERVFLGGGSKGHMGL